MSSSNGQPMFDSRSWPTSIPLTDTLMSRARNPSGPGRAPVSSAVTSHGPSVVAEIFLGRAEADLHLPALQIAGRPVVEDGVAEHVLSRLLRAQRCPVACDDDGHFELEVQELRAGRDRDVVVRADQRVRVGEVERRCLVPLRHHTRAVSDAGHDALDMLLERDKVPHGRRGQRRQQPDLSEGTAGADRAAVRFQARQTRADQVEDGDTRRQGVQPVSSTIPAVRVPPLSGWRTSSDRGGHEQALVGVVERLGGDKLAHLVGGIHSSATSGWVKWYMWRCKVSSSICSSSVVYSTVLPCGSRKK